VLSNNLLGITTLFVFLGINQLNSTVIEERKRGKVKWFNVSKGFGFICCGDIPEDIMVHFSEVQITIAGTRNLFEGQTVEFNLIKTENKGYSAQDVKLIL
jgi:CspA family cold shock protein